MWEEKLAFYDKLIAQCPEFERLGKTMPYTSANGYMFSQLNKAGEIGIRFSDETMKKLIKKHQTTPFKSYGAVMKGYILIPEELYEAEALLVQYLRESYQYVQSLKPK